MGLVQEEDVTSVGMMDEVASWVELEELAKQLNWK